MGRLVGVVCMIVDVWVEGGSECDDVNGTSTLGFWDISFPVLGVGFALGSTEICCAETCVLSKLTVFGLHDSDV